MTEGTTPITDEYMRASLAQTKSYVLVLLKAGEQYHSADPSVIWEHGRRNFALRDEGLMPIVGPVLDDSDLCGVCIFDANEADAARIMDGDPGVQAGIFTYEVHPVRGFPGSALP